MIEKGNFKPITRKLRPAKKKRHGAREKVQLKLVKKPTVPLTPEGLPGDEYGEIGSVAQKSFAKSFALEMKRAALKAKDKAQKEEEIRLTRRPVTRAQGRNTEKFPAADLREFKRLLIEARNRATLGVDAMKATGLNEAEDHEADGGDGTAQTQRLQALGQMGNINRTIQQIDEALHRIEEGTYGVCTACGQLIRKPRLLNQPFVLTCMECQNEMERESK